VYQRNLETEFVSLKTLKSSVTKAGKKLEALFRRGRTYLSPAYRRAFDSMVARGMAQRLPVDRLVCCDFYDPRIDAVGGRYYFGLVRDLLDAGYFPVFTAVRETVSSFGTSRMKSLLLKERLGVITSLDELKEPYLLITDRDIPKPALADKMVRVRYEQRLCAGENEIAFPMFVHPQIATKVDLPPVFQPAQKRASRIFFGGNTEEAKYDNDVLRDVYGMLTRRQMLDIVCESVGEAAIHRPQSSDAWLTSQQFHSFVLCETQHCKIPGERWLDALAKADFFLACPGVGMPLCHNLIEAMAAGAIPILQYGGYLQRPLVNGVNCVSFTDSEDLRKVTTGVLAMSEEQVRALRENIRAYYAEFYAPGQFARSLFAEPLVERNLLMNAYRVPRK
jgi:hypothetical protein